MVIMTIVEYRVFSVVKIKTSTLFLETEFCLKLFVLIGLPPIWCRLVTCVHMSHRMRKHAKTKAQTSFAVTMKLISDFVFATQHNSSSS